MYTERLSMGEKWLDTRKDLSVSVEPDVASSKINISAERCCESCSVTGGVISTVRTCRDE